MDLRQLFEASDPTKPLHLNAEEAAAVRLEAARQALAAKPPINRSLRRKLMGKNKRGLKRG